MQDKEIRKKKTDTKKDPGRIAVTQCRADPDNEAILRHKEYEGCS